MSKKTSPTGFKVLILGVLSISLMACSTPAPVAQTQDAIPASPIPRTPANHSWGDYHWARTSPQFALKLGDNLTTADWHSHLSTASTNWNSPEDYGASFTPVLTVITRGRAKRNCAMVSGTVQVCNGKYGSNGWLGLASINLVNGDHITQGSAKMNDSYFSLAAYNNPNEKLHVMCQEVAHTFGLAHQSEDGSSQNSCMDYFANIGANATSTMSTQPNAHDFEELNLVYGNHLDNSTTVAPVIARSSANDVSEDPKSWGQLRSQSRNGRHSTYERTNRDGSVTLTHVYWIQEAAAKCAHCDHREEFH